MLSFCSVLTPSATCGVERWAKDILFGIIYTVEIIVKIVGFRGRFFKEPRMSLRCDRNGEGYWLIRSVLITILETEYPPWSMLNIITYNIL